MKGMAGGSIGAMVIAGFIGYIVYARVAGRTLPMLDGPRAFWAVLALGFTACALGGIGVGLARTGGSFLDPFMIAASVIGIAILALSVAFATGMRLPLPAGEHTALVALAGLVAAKYAVTLAHGATVALSR